MPSLRLADYPRVRARALSPFTSGDDEKAKRTTIGLIDGLGFAAVDLGSLAVGGAMHEVDTPRLDLHLVRRLCRAPRRRW